MPGPVSVTTISTAPSRQRAASVIRPSLVYFAALSATFASACSTSAWFVTTARSRGHEISNRDTGRRSQPGPHLRQQRRERDNLRFRRLDSGLRPGESQERPGQARQPVRLALDVPEKRVALRTVLRARLEHFDRADDPGERALQLMGGVRDELSLGALAARVTPHRHHDPFVAEFTRK